MKAQQIKGGMTKGEWKYTIATWRNAGGEAANGVDIYTWEDSKGVDVLISGIVPPNEVDVRCTSSEPTETCLINSAAICNAVNATYGNSINPEIVKEMNTLLIEESKYLSSWINGGISLDVLHRQMKERLDFINRTISRATLK